MSHEISRPEWVKDSLVEERGKYAGFQMYSTEGNDAVAEMVIAVIARAEQAKMLPAEIKATLAAGVAEVAKVHPEIHDTEPEWAIVDAMNEWLEKSGFAPIDRDAF